MEAELQAHGHAEATQPGFHSEQISFAIRTELREAFSALEEKLSELLETETARAEQAFRTAEERNRVLHAENKRLCSELGEPGIGDQAPPRKHAQVDLVASELTLPSTDLATHSPTLLHSTIISHVKAKSPHSLDLQSSKGNHAVVMVSSDDESYKPAASQSHAHRAIATMCKRRHRDSDNSARASMPMPSVMASLGENTCEMLPFWKGLIDSKMGPTATHLNKSLARYHKRAHSKTFKDILSAGPMSVRRIVWETIGAVLIVSDLVTIPMQAFVFDGLLPPHMDLAKAVYWSLDIPSSFFVGYYTNGFIESRFRKTAKHYAQSWFAVDLVLVVLEWTLLVLQHQMNCDNHWVILRAGRILRLLRFIRLIRLFKLHAFFSKLFEAIHSEYVLTFMHVSRIVVSIIVVNHFIACLWYTIGTMDSHISTDKSWVDKNFDAADGVAYRYATSLHWSITQFTPASMEVVPRNSIERVFTVIVIILGMVTFSTFVSSITQAMTHLRKIAGAKDAQFAQLRHYLGENNVSMELAMRVWRYFEQGTRVRQQRTMWRQVELFADCPELLEMELQHEVYTPTLAKHPLFHYIQENSFAAMRAICHTAVREMSFRTDQDVFKVGQAVDKVYFVISGQLEYRMKFGGESMLTSASNIIASDEVRAGEWISEAAIWVKWFHMGTTVAKVPSLLLVVSVPAFHQVVGEYLDLLPDCITYAALFAQQLRAQGLAMSDIANAPEQVLELAGMAFGKEYGLTAADRSHTHASAKGLLMRGFSRLSQRRPRWGERTPHGDLASRHGGSRNSSARSELVSELGAMSPRTGTEIPGRHIRIMRSRSDSVVDL